MSSSDDDATLLVLLVMTNKCCNECIPYIECNPECNPCTQKNFHFFSRKSFLPSPDSNLIDTIQALQVLQLKWVFSDCLVTMFSLY